MFVVVGDVDAAGARRGGQPIRRHATRLDHVPFEDEPEQPPREAVREMDGATYDLVFAWPTVKLSHPGMYALDGRVHPGEEKARGWCSG